MSDMKINGAGAGQGIQPIKPISGEQQGGFEDMMQEAIGKISQVQTNAEQAVKELASGGDPGEAIIAMNKADQDFQVMVEVRNKLLAAYEKVMNMQV